MNLEPDPITMLEIAAEAADAADARHDAAMGLLVRSVLRALADGQHPLTIIHAAGWQSQEGPKMVQTPFGPVPAEAFGIEPADVMEQFARWTGREVSKLVMEMGREGVRELEPFDPEEDDDD